MYYVQNYARAYTFLALDGKLVKYCLDMLNLVKSC